MDLALISRYLREPVRQPEYREQRSHSLFVGNLGLDSAGLRRALARAWEAVAADDSGWPQEATRRLVEAKYSLESWNLQF
jgi:hypothetical protein